MATRIAARYVSRQLSSSGKVLSEEEKAAENVYIKKTEQEKLEKLARKTLDCQSYFSPCSFIPLEYHSLSSTHPSWLIAARPPKPEEAPAASSGGAGSVADAKPSGHASSPPKVSTDNYRNYAVIADIATIAAATGWYLGSRKKKTEEVQD